MYNKLNDIYEKQNRLCPKIHLERDYAKFYVPLSFLDHWCLTMFCVSMAVPPVLTVELVLLELLTESCIQSKYANFASTYQATKFKMGFLELEVKNGCVYIKSYPFLTVKYPTGTIAKWYVSANCMDIACFILILFGFICSSISSPFSTYFPLSSVTANTF